MMWLRDTSSVCSNEDEGNVTVSGNSTNFTITELEENSNYRISLRTVNRVGSVLSNTTTATTLEAGKI